MSLSTGNISKIRAGTLRAARFRRQAHEQVLLHRQARKDLAALRHVADAEARPLVGRERCDVPPSKVMLPERTGTQADQALEQRGLADAVAPEHGRAGALGNLEAHVAQDVAAAVVLVEFEIFSMVSACAGRAVDTTARSFTPR